MPRDFLARSLRDIMHWSSLRSLLRTYERSTSSKSSVLFTDTKSGPMKKRTTPIYATCSSPIMHLICPPKFCITIMFNLEGQIRYIMGDVQVAEIGVVLFFIGPDIVLVNKMLDLLCYLSYVFKSERRRASMHEVAQRPSYEVSWHNQPGKKIKDF